MLHVILMFMYRLSKTASLNFVYEPAHDITYYKTCATSEVSDQPAHLRSLIRVFADRMRLLQPPGYPEG